MTKHDVAFLACRMMAIYAALLTLQRFAYISLDFRGYFGPSDWRPTAAVMVLSTVVAIGLTASFALLLWIGADRIASMMCPGAELEPAGPSITAQCAEEIAFSAVGLFILVRAIPKLAQELIRLLMLPPDAMIPRITEPMWFAEFGSTLAECVIGAWLALGPRWWARWIRALRNVGQH